MSIETKKKEKKTKGKLLTTGAAIIGLIITIIGGKKKG